MSLLVTGGAGFIGSHFIERSLRASDEPIVCVDNFNDYYDPRLKRANVRAFADDPRVTVVEDSFGNMEAMRHVFTQHKINRVLHLGAYAGVRPSLERPLIYIEANVRDTCALLEVAKDFPLERFVLASSSTVYGRGAKSPFQEDQHWGIALSPYGASKQAAETLLWTYRDIYGIPGVVVRPFSVYGPRVRPDLAMSQFAHAILEGRALTLFGDGSIRRDFTHVTDICAGLAASLTIPEAVGQAFNLGHNEPVAIKDLIVLLEKACGRSAVIERRPQAPGDMPLTHADLSKSDKFLSYRPSVPLPEGVLEYVNWIQRHGC